jgi:hypothetical protein
MKLKVTDFLKFKKNWMRNNVIKNLPIRGCTQVDTHKQSIFLQNYLISYGFKWSTDTNEDGIHDFWTIHQRWYLYWCSGELSHSNYKLDDMRTPFINYYDYFYE